MKNYMDGGEAILEAFRKLKIDYIMSSPGSEWSPVWEALARQQLEKRPGPTFVDSWHETLAVNMATGYTLITGRLQAVLLHAGVGVLQGSMGIHGALQTEVPMIVMSGESQTVGENPDLPIEPQWYGGLSVGGIERFIEPVTKWARAVTSPFTLYESVIRAGEMAQRLPRGPIYLNVALEHMLHPWESPADTREVPPAPKVQASPREIETVAAMLAKATNPVIVAETAGRDPEAFTALTALAELAAVPVIAGRSNHYANFPTDHPLYLGMGSYRFLEDADLVLLVGARAPWYPPRRRPTAGRIVAIAETAYREDMVYQNLHADSYLEGDVATSLRLIATALKADGLDPTVISERRARWSREHENFVAGLRTEEEKARAQDRIDPLALVSVAGEVLPPDTIFVDETITHSPILRQHLPMTRPQSFFRGYGGLGQGIGTALGIKLAARERPVVLMVGDGSFLYNPVIQALGASKQHGLPVLIIVLNNRCYAAMRQGHVHHYPDGASASADLFYGVKIDGPNYDELGKHFDLPGRRVEKPGDLKAALTWGLKTVREGKTAILNVLVSR
jgi:acetolactate synthase-1/2/3 large subunit